MELAGCIWPCQATVVCGDSHSLAIASGGELYAWGKAYAGRCGIPDVAGMPTDDDVPYQPIPRQVVSGGLVDRRVVAVAGGRWHNLAIGEGGELYAWGAADAGRCGFADTADMPRDEDNWPFQPVPRLVSGGALQGRRVVAVACGENHSLVVTAEGELLAWGSLHLGRCGFADGTGLPTDDEDHPYQPTPRRVTGGALDGKHVTFVACGTFHSLAVTKAGELFAWGSACTGRCGFADLEGLPVDQDGVHFQPVPRQVIDGDIKGKPVAFAACSEGHSFVISCSGDLYAWGSADAGRCGLGDTDGLPADPEGVYQPVPTLVHSGGLRANKVKSVACGSWHSLAVTQGAELYAWGATRAGRCGFEDTSGLPSDENGPFQPVPRQVVDGGLRDRKVALAACGSWHSLAATADGSLYAWGVALMSRCGFATAGMPVDDLCPYQPTPLAVVAMPRVRLGDALRESPRGPEAVCADLRRLLSDESYADVCFEVDGEKLRAHVAILSARCDYFRRMFQSGMAECRVSDAAEDGCPGSATDGIFGPPIRRVVITDCGAPAFRQLLFWLYSGAIDAALPTEELACILRLADVYRIPGLGDLCERQLCLHIDVDNVVALLQVALATRASDLEVACLKYAVQHVAVVRRHPSYDDCRSMDVVRRVAAAWAGELEFAREHSHL